MSLRNGICGRGDRFAEADTRGGEDITIYRPSNNVGVDRPLCGVGHIRFCSIAFRIAFPTGEGVAHLGGIGRCNDGSTVRKLHFAHRAVNIPLDGVNADIGGDGEGLFAFKIVCGGLCLDDRIPRLLACAKLTVSGGQRYRHICRHAVDKNIVLNGFDQPIERVCGVVGLAKGDVLGHLAGFLRLDHDVLDVKIHAGCVGCRKLCDLEVVFGHPVNDQLRDEPRSGKLNRAFTKEVKRNGDTFNVIIIL